MVRRNEESASFISNLKNSIDLTASKKSFYRSFIP